MTERKRILGAHVEDNLFECFQHLAAKNNVTVAVMLRAVIVDALFEEGFLGRIGQAGHSQITESREAGGSPQQ